MAYRFGISTHLTMVASSTGTQLSGTVWYPDPGGGTQQRYWDGFRWTEHLR
jgi:uncharacterized protein DUF2510